MCDVAATTHGGHTTFLYKLLSDTSLLRSSRGCMNDSDLTRRHSEAARALCDSKQSISDWKVILLAVSMNQKTSRTEFCANTVTAL